MFSTIIASLTIVLGVIVFFMARRQKREIRAYIRELERMNTPQYRAQRAADIVQIREMFHEQGQRTSSRSTTARREDGSVDHSMTLSHLIAASSLDDAPSSSTRPNSFGGDSFSTGGSFGGSSYSSGSSGSDSSSSSSDSSSSSSCGGGGCD